MCIYTISYSYTVVHATRYRLMYHVTHAKHVESPHIRSDEMVKHSRDEAVLFSAYPVHGSASKVNLTQVLKHKSSPVTVILSSFIALLSS